MYEYELDEIEENPNTALVWAVVGIIAAFRYAYQLGVVARFAFEKINDYIDSNKKMRRAYILQKTRQYYEDAQNEEAQKYEVQKYEDIKGEPWEEDQA